MRRAAVLFLLLVSLLAAAKDKAKEEFRETHDEIYGNHFYYPNSQPSIGGLLTRLKVYPYIGENTTKGRRWLRMRFHYWNLNQVSSATIVVDGQDMPIPSGATHHKDGISYYYDWPGDDVARAVASGKNVWLILHYYSGTSDRVQFSADSLECFRRVIAKFDELQQDSPLVMKDSAPSKAE